MLRQLHKNRLCLPVLLLLLWHLPVLAQDRNITGKIVSAKDQSALPGNRGSERYYQGHQHRRRRQFRHRGRTGAGAHLHRGFKAQELPVASVTSPLSIQLEEDAQKLNEVVVVGYGVQ